MFSAERDDIFEVEDHGQLVHVDVRNNVVNRHGGIVREVFGAEKSFLLTGNGDKHDGAAGMGAHGRKSMCHFYKRGGSGGVVECTVIDGIAILRVTNTKV